jgi:hypothetical protein
VQQPTGYATITDGNTITDGTAVFKAVDLIGAINTASGKADNAQSTANTASGKADIVQAQVSNSGDAYDSTKAYAVGDLCIYDNVLYRCTTACSAGSWATNQSCFIADTLVNAVNKRHTEYNSGSITSLSSTDYICPYDGYAIIIPSNNAITSRSRLWINGNLMAQVTGNGTYSNEACVFVRAGMKIHVDGDNYEGYYRPLI